MAVLTAASADVGCSPFSKPYRHRSLCSGRTRLLYVAARPKPEIFAVTLSCREGLNKVVIVVFPYHSSSRTSIVCMNFPVGNILRPFHARYLACSRKPFPFANWNQLANRPLKFADGHSSRMGWNIYGARRCLRIMGDLNLTDLEVLCRRPYPAPLHGC